MIAWAGRSSVRLPFWRQFLDIFRDVELPDDADLASNAFSTTEDLNGLREEWADLAARCGAGAFQSYDFVRTMARVQGAARKRISVVTMREEGRLIGVLPLAVGSQAGIRVATFIGAPYAQYDDALVDPAEPHAARRLLRAAAKLSQADVLMLRRVRADAALAPALGNLEIIEKDAACIVSLRGKPNVDAVVAGLSGKKRQALRRGQRELAALGSVTSTICCGKAALPHALAALAAKRQWVSDSGRIAPALASSRMVALLEGLAEADSQDLITTTLKLGDTPIAWEIGFVADRAYLAFLGAFDHRYAHAGPGNIQMLHTMAWCIEQGMDSYDLLAPMDDYKKRWASHVVPVRDACAVLSVKGFVWSSMWRKRLRPFLRTVANNTGAALGRITPRSRPKPAGAVVEPAKSAALRTPSSA
jgi:CelD/BcsL family acetyltransferase involved in cellulose biosynthesis